MSEVLNKKMEEVAKENAEAPAKVADSIVPKDEGKKLKEEHFERIEYFILKRNDLMSQAQHMHNRCEKYVESIKEDYWPKSEKVHVDLVKRNIKCQDKKEK